MCIGMSVGMLIGQMVFDNMALGMGIGMSIGVAIGAALDAEKRKSSDTGEALKLIRRTAMNKSLSGEMTAALGAAMKAVLILRSGGRRMGTHLTRLGIRS